jgi:hypothetical protein
MTTKVSQLMDTRDRGLSDGKIRVSKHDTKFCVKDLDKSWGMLDQEAIG